MGDIDIFNQFFRRARPSARAVGGATEFIGDLKEVYRPRQAGQIIYPVHIIALYDLLHKARPLGQITRLRILDRLPG